MDLKVANDKGGTRLNLENWPIVHLHYDVIRAKPDGSCCRPAETGPSVS